MYITGSFANLENRIHQLTENGTTDLNSYRWEALCYFPLSGEGYRGQFNSRWSKELQKKHWSYNSEWVTGNYVLSVVDYDVSARAIFSGMTEQPDRERKNLIGTIVNQLKANSLWDKLDVLYFFAAHDEQSAKINWKNPSQYSISGANNPTFTTDVGFRTAGTGDYLSWQWSPTSGVNFTQNSGSIGFWTQMSGQFTGDPFGTSTGVQITINPWSVSNQFSWRINSSTSNSSGISYASGLSSICRSGASTSYAYRNGVMVASGGGVSSALSPASINMGRTNSQPVASPYTAAFAGRYLTPAENATIYNIFNTYVSDVGANIPVRV